MDTMSGADVGNGQDSILEPIPYSSDRLELTEAKLQGLELWPPTPALLGVEHNWPEPRVVAKNCFDFLKKLDNPTALYSSS